VQFGEKPTFRSNILLYCSESKIRICKKRTEVGGKLAFQKSNCFPYACDPLSDFAYVV
jgi:hypothetical protein